MLSSITIGATAVVALITPSIDASAAGFALAFASTLTEDVGDYLTRDCSSLTIHTTSAALDSYCSWYDFLFLLSMILMLNGIHRSVDL